MFQGRLLVRNQHFKSGSTVNYPPFPPPALRFGSERRAASEGDVTLAGLDGADGGVVAAGGGSHLNAFRKQRHK